MQSQLEHGLLTNLEGLLANLPPLPHPPTGKSVDNKHMKKRAAQADEAYQKVNSTSNRYRECLEENKVRLGVILDTTTTSKKRKAVAEELVAAYAEQQDVLKEHLEAAKACYNLQLEATTIDSARYHKGLTEVNHKRRKLFAYASMFKRNHTRITKNAARGSKFEGEREELTESYTVISMFKRLLLHEAEARDGDQIIFRNDLVDYLGAKNKDGQFWCPFYKSWYDSHEVRAVHLAPYTLGYDVMNGLFGVPPAGVDHCMIVKNGLIMHKEIEKGFDQHRFCLLPIERPDGRFDWKVKILSTDDENARINGTTFWKSLDGVVLAFQNLNRPSRRYLYFHYCMCLLKAVEDKKTGWESAHEANTRKSWWVTPGPYLRTTLLRHFTRLNGDESAIPEEVLKMGDLGDEGYQVDLSTVEGINAAFLQFKDFDQMSVACGKVMSKVEDDEASSDSCEEEQDGDLD